MTIEVHQRVIEAEADLLRHVEEVAEGAEVVLEVIRGVDADPLLLGEEVQEVGLVAGVGLVAARPPHVEVDSIETEDTGTITEEAHPVGTEMNIAIMADIVLLPISIRIMVIPMVLLLWEVQEVAIPTVHLAEGAAHHLRPTIAEVVTAVIDADATKAFREFPCWSGILVLKSLIKTLAWLSDVSGRFVMFTSQEITTRNSLKASLSLSMLIPIKLVRLVMRWIAFVSRDVN